MGTRVRRRRGGATAAHLAGELGDDRRRRLQDVGRAVLGWRRQEGDGHQLVVLRRTPDSQSGLQVSSSRAFGTPPLGSPLAF